MTNNPQSKTPDFEWKETVIPEQQKPKCDHYFELQEGSKAECKNCGMGLIGVYRIDNGRPVV